VKNRDSRICFHYKITAGSVNCCDFRKAQTLLQQKHPLQPPVDKLQGAGGGDVKADFVSLRPAKPEANPGGGLP